MRMSLLVFLFAALAIGSSSNFGQSSNVPPEWQSWGAETDWELEAIAKLILKGEPNAEKFKGVLVLPLKEANAFVSPEGFLIITEGLLERLNGQDEIAFVVAHELAHLIKGHPRNLETNPTRLERIRTEVERGLGTSVIGTGLQLLVNAVASYYSREREREADAEAVRLMAKAGFDINAAKRALKNLSDERGFLSWFRSHPFLSERLDIVDNSIRRWRAFVSDTPKLEPPPDRKFEVYVELRILGWAGAERNLWQEFSEEVSKNFWSSLAEEAKLHPLNFQPVKRWQRHRAEFWGLQVELKEWQISPLPQLNDWLRWELRMEWRLIGKSGEIWCISEERFSVTFGKGEQIRNVVIGSASLLAKRLAKFVTQNCPKRVPLEQGTH
ncbi:MAG: M48 family metallopeptidase [Armatimonadetes bacterium]|nr:M48 family metallopeptidase [Armatimonadota bacterium]MDW8029043.1 M48 family metallopeptidase [Armatimonadota bacterium]